MNTTVCGYTGDREAALMGYLYGELAPDERAAFDAHLTSCARCRTELAGFGGVRRELARWSPPGFTSVVRSSGPLQAPGAGAAWRRIPVWAQVAAAMLFVGVSAAIANLDIHYDSQSGLNVRTGWAPQRNAPDRANLANAAKPTNAATVQTLVDRPWRADLTALEQQLRSEMHAGSNAAAPVPAHASASNDADVMRRVKALVDESERRQQRELALRVTSLLQDLNAQRQTDLRRIDQSLGLIQNRTGVEVLKNRQMIDYYMQRVSQRP